MTAHTDRAWEAFLRAVDAPEEPEPTPDPETPPDGQAAARRAWSERRERRTFRYTLFGH